jgi:hypothetical protein
MDEALPVSDRAAFTATRASSQMGGVAFQSKYARSDIVLASTQIPFLLLGPAKSLLFALGIVVEARNRPVLIACAEAGNSGNHIIIIILI